MICQTSQQPFFRVIRNNTSVIFILNISLSLTSFVIVTQLLTASEQKTNCMCFVQELGLVSTKSRLFIFIKIISHHIKNKQTVGVKLKCPFCQDD